MARSLGEMSSGAEGAKQTTGYEGIVPPSAGKRFEEKPSKGPSKQEIMDRRLTVDQTTKSVGPVFNIPSGQRGQAGPEGKRAGTKDVSVPFHEMHKAYSTIINNGRSFRKNPLGSDHHDAMDVASGHLMNSIVSYHKAVGEGRMGKHDMDTTVAHGHLQDAVEHMALAHKTLVESGVHDSLQSRKLHAPLPSSDAVADLRSKSLTLKRQGVDGIAGKKKPYKEGVIGKDSSLERNRGTTVIRSPGRGTAEFTDRDVSDLARVFGNDHPGIQRIRAMAGTPRGQDLRISREDRREGVTKQLGAGVATGSFKNPKRRASQKRIDVEYRTDANPSNNTGGKPRP
jgi:hypothetical protein